MGGGGVFVLRDQYTGFRQNFNIIYNHNRATHGHGSMLIQNTKTK